MTACLKCGHDPSARVVVSWSFQVDRDPPSLNERLFNAGPRRWAYARQRDTWSLEFINARNLQRMPFAQNKRRVTLTRLYDGRQKERDVDNLFGGGKVVVDALVHAHILVSDAPRDAEIHWTQERGARGLRVLVEELAL